VARREYGAALDLLKRVAETPESVALIGDLQAHLGDRGAAEDSYRRAERLEREGWQYEQPQPAALARLLAERNRGAAEAVALAEKAASERQDINTLDALAWSYFRAGRLEDAASAIGKATRTGTLDPRVRCHEGAINASRDGRVADERLCDPLSLVGAAAEPIRSARLHVDTSERR
jgi:tetratricopeptide (TPR) repeat protein